MGASVSSPMNRARLKDKKVGQQVPAVVYSPSGSCHILTQAPRVLAPAFLETICMCSPSWSPLPELVSGPAGHEAVPRNRRGCWEPPPQPRYNILVVILDVQLISSKDS